jgi:hypothetical protein
MLGSSVRFEDGDYVLRLFPTKELALAYPDVIEAVLYGCGWIAKSTSGEWIDHVGPLPPKWIPSANFVNQAVQPSS